MQHIGKFIVLFLLVNYILPSDSSNNNQETCHYWVSFFELYTYYLLGSIISCALEELSCRVLMNYDSTSRLLRDVSRQHIQMGSNAVSNQWF